jgi:cytochrome c-type biogenesis protein
MELTFIIVLTAGLATFLSPCILPLIPTYLSYISGVAAKDLKNSNKSKIFFNTLVFILGFTSAFVLLQFLLINFANAVSKVISNNLFYNIMGIIVIVFGLQVMGVINLKFLMFEKKLNVNVKLNGRFFVSFILGFLFGFGWSPCMGPILFSVIAYTSQAETALLGVYYLVIYSFGLGIPLLIFSLFFENLTGVTNFLKKHYSIIEKLSGFILIIIGLLFFFDKLSFFSNL